MTSLCHYWQGLGHSICRGDVVVVPRSGRVQRYELHGGFMAGAYCVDCSLFGKDCALEDIVVSSDYLLVYSRTSGRGVFYERKHMELIGFFEKKLKLGQSITSIIASNKVNELFFMTLSDENTIQPIYVSNNLDNTINNKKNKKDLALLGMNYMRGKVKVGSPVALEIQGIGTSITTGYVAEIIDNHSNNILIVRATTGVIFLWEYSNIIEFLARDSIPEAADLDDSTDTAVIDSRHTSLSYLSIRKPTQLYFKPAGIILPLATSSTATSLCAHPTGKFLGVVWSAANTAVYDIEACINSIKHQRIASLKPMKVQAKSADRVISIDFHAFQPLLYQFVSRRGTTKAQEYHIQVLSLLSPALDALSSHRLINDKLPALSETVTHTRLYSIPQSSSIAVVYADIVSVYKLDIDETLLHPAISSHYSISPDSYIVPKEYKEYNNLLRTNVAVISSTSCFSEKENMSNSLRSTLTLTSFDKSKTVVSGEVPRPTNSSDDVATIAVDIPPTDLLEASNGCVIYSDISIVERFVLVKGIFQTMKQEKLVSVKCLHIININEDSWVKAGRVPATLQGNTRGILTSYADYSYVNGVLAVINQSGAAIKLFNYKEHKLVFTAVCELSLRIHSLLLLPGNFLLYSTQQDAKKVSSLHLSSYDNTTVHQSRSKLLLLPHESTKQLLLQPATTQITLISTGKYVGILTNYRVFILDISSESSMHIVSEVHCDGLHDRYNVLTRNEGLTSITWLLANLVVTSDNGSIYCVTLPLCETKANPTINVAMGCAMGIIHEKNTFIRRLGSVALGNRLHSTPKIVGILPDRVLLTNGYSKSNGEVGFKLSIQPFLPVQSLILSVLPLAVSDPGCTHILTLLVLYYYRSYLEAERIENNSIRKVSTTHSARYLGYVLWSYGHTALSALVAGLVTTNTYASSSSYITNIPYGVAFYYNFLLKNYADTKVSLNIVDTIAPETLYYSQFFSRFHLNVLNVLYSHELLPRCVELILAYHLDELVSLIINRVSPNNKRELLTLLETKNKYLFDLYILAEHDYHIARVMRESRPKVIDSLNHYHIGQLHNKRSISQSATTLPFLMTPHHSWFICQENLLQGNLAAAAMDSLKAMSVSSNDYRKLMSLDPSNVLNGPFSMVNNAATDVMLLEWVEDIIGCRFTLQTTMSEQSVSSNPRNPSNNNEVSSNNEVVSKSNAGWLDVGTGKEWEKIVGYWRFSDAIIPSNDEKTSIIKSYKAMQSAQQHLEVVLAIADLSKYANHLYILKPNTATNHVRIERTTNPSVDPGEDHSKVKALCDIVFTTTLSSNVSTHVLYSPIPRGSGLDVGLYHTEQDRAKMTIELNICYERGIGNTVLQPLTYLLQRVCHNATTIWSLAIDIDGYFLIFIAEKKIKIDKILIPNEEVASWRHVAVTIDTSASISSTYGTSAVITVYFDGKHVKQEVVDVPVVSEDVLQASHLYLGSNMGCGWRMTEIRVWSDIRDSIEIEREKDNYLSLASKRKRLQLRVPTSKLFFSPFDDNIFDFTSVMSKISSPMDTTAPSEVSVTGSSGGIAGSSGGLAGSTTGSTGSKLLRPLSMLKKKEL